MIRPVDLPRLRAELSQHLRSDLFASGSTVEREWEHPLLGTVTPREYGSLTAQILDGADLFYVSEEMTDLAHVAAQSLPPIGLDQHDPPSKAGLIFFQRGLGTILHGEPPIEYRIAAVSWREVRESGILVDRYTLRDDMLNGLVAAGIASERDALYSRERMPTLVPLGGGSSWIPFGAADADEGSQRVLAADRGVRAAWLLMQQPLAVTSEANYNRSDRRRLERMRVEPKPVRIISLRRPASSSGSGETGREYQHQWIVRGHWRQQYYPSRDTHRPVWIAPHIKGPEGAPMLGGEKVYSWTK